MRPAETHLDTYEAMARTYFGITGHATPLPGYDDTNVRIDTGNRKYVLRISDPETPLEVAELCDTAMEAAASAPFTTPRPIPVSDGSRTVVEARGTLVRLQTWVDGETYSHRGHPPSVARSIGQTAAHMVEALSHMETDVVRSDTWWDLRHAIETIDTFIVHLHSSAQRQTIRAVRRVLISEDLASLPQQVIHGDLNTGNLLLADDTVVGVIDFGDVRMSYRIAELAIACAYAMLGQDDPVTVANAACQGYREIADVAVCETRLLFPLILARLATSACVAATQADDNPQHHETEGDTWDLIERLITGDLAGMTDELAGALGGVPRAPHGSPTLLDTRNVLASSLSLSYTDPLTIVRGRGQYLFDERGRRFLDCVNNVAHVGHSNPVVNQAASDQMRVLNTNTRYLHPSIVRYADRLVASMPQQLDTVFVVNSGSEANELAIRLARTATGRFDVACIDHGYHGNTTTLVCVSPYKFNGPGGDGQPDWVHVLPSLDGYRESRYSGPSAPAHYATEAAAVLANASLSTLIVEALPGSAGQVVPAPGVLNAAYEAARERGALIIADEVQTGMGRVGAAFWAFDLADVEPDIVTIGKPAGNGHPLAAVITTRAIANAFDTGMEYFNTFGGNPVSAAVGNAVLDVMDQENLQEHALRVGNVLMDGLRELSTHHPSIGDVRGAGLFIGVELVVDRASRLPHPSLAAEVVEYAKTRGVLVSVDGPHRNVIKIKPPLVFDLHDAGRLVNAIEQGILARPSNT
ncbi:MAG: aminotransferase class III-fold pyridoxal phosphate-dependent enzyme [Actinomycetia bacterium]|nr:aminotransferase class III-fold pyridoxal phosphate-dependent enzyme [Actinomycetes bacterium]